MTDNSQSGATGNENLWPKMDATPDDNSRPASFASAVSSQLQTTDTPASSATHTTVGIEREEEEWTPPANGPLKTPIPQPSRHSQIAPQPKLTAEQESKYNAVLEQLSQWTTIPISTVKGAAQTPLGEHERMFLTRECLLRYLRATKWKTADAVRRLQETLSWRREYGADTFTHDYISPENETGKQIQLGFDNHGRPCLYLNPGKQNTKTSDRQIHHLCYMLDRTVDMMPAGVENSALIVNFQGAATGNVPSVGQARAVLNILQGHNPERLGRALISKTPWYVNTFFKLISPFIDPVTREKMKFNEDLRKYIPAEQLWKDDGGDLNFEYDHALYWPAFEAECKKRRDAYRTRWEVAGRRIGEYEEYLRGGSHPSLQQESEQANGMAASTQSQIADSVAEGVAKLNV